MPTEPPQLPIGTSKNRTAWIIGGAAVAAVLLAVGGWMLLTRHDPPTETEPPASESASPSGEAAEVVAALKQLETDPHALLPPELEEEFGGEIDMAIPRGATVEPDATTWRASDAGGGTIEVALTSPDGSTSSVIAVMARYPDGWKVLQTLDVAGGEG